MQKVLTIVIPTYNMQAYLKRCLDSLIVENALLEQLEVLVVNDGSKDDSSRIAHRYEDNHPRTFRVIDKENGNYGSCVNRGLAEANGKDIKVLDADDWFDTGNFRDYLVFLAGMDADMVLSDFDQVSEEGTVVYAIHYGLDPEKEFDCSAIPKDRLFLMHAVAYKTENLRSIGYVQSEGISYTDQEWIFLPMITVDSIRYFGKPVYKYLVGREGQTMDPKVFARHFSQEMTGTRRMMDLFETYKDSVSPVHRPYLIWRLETRIHLVYSWFLIRAYRGMEIGMLNDFDAGMKEKYPASWELSDKLKVSKRIPYRFIRAYRRFHSKYYPSIVLYRMYLRIK